MAERSDNTRAFLAEPTMHLCVDMQRMFADETDWQAPWMRRVLPRVEALVAHRPQDTVLTRFMPPRTAGEAEGRWRNYFGRWHQFTLDEADPGLVDIVPELACFAPPATVFDKPAYSPFSRTGLDRLLRERGARTLIVSGAETDVCVLSAVMDAVDHGFAVVVPKDGLCSSTDATHDALIALYARRFGQQISLSDTRTIMDLWR